VKSCATFVKVDAELAVFFSSKYPPPVSSAIFAAASGFAADHALAVE